MPTRDGAPIALDFADWAAELNHLNVFARIYETGVLYRVSAARSVLSTIHKAVDRFGKMVTCLHQRETQ